MSAPQTQAERPRLVTIVKLLFLVISGLLVVRILVSADLERVGALIGANGAWVLLGLLPYIAAITIDTIGWRIVLGALGRAPAIGRLLLLRLSTEAVLLSMPMGPAVAESMKAYLLERRMGVPVSEGVSSIAAKKALLTSALALFMVTSVVVGFPYLQAASEQMIGRAGLPWAILAGAVVVMLAATLMSATLRHGGLAERLHALLVRIPIARLRSWLQARRRGFTDVDAHFSPIGAARARMAAAGATFYLGWVVEALESFLLLKLVGADISLAQLIALEASVMFIRSAAMFVPAGIGFQDAGYLAFLSAFGIPDAVSVGTAFVVLKRGKELVWIVVGYLILLGERTRRQDPPTANGKPRVLLVCGSLNQTQQMQHVAEALGSGVECRFSPYIVDGYLAVARHLGLLEMSIGGNRLRRRCLDYLGAQGLATDVDGEQGNYHLIVTCSDIVMPRITRTAPVVVVQEGMTDPEGFLFRLHRLLPWLVPRWVASTATTGMSGAYHTFCVASPGYRKFFHQKKGVPFERMAVTGIPNFDDCERYRQNTFPHHRHVLVCTSDCRETYRADARLAFLARCVELAAGRKLIVKLHPNEDVARATREVAQVAPQALVYANGSAEEMIANCSVLICQWSSLAYVGLALGKEVHSYFDLDELRELVPLQNRSAARNIAEICRRVLAETRETAPQPLLAPVPEPGEPAPAASGSFRRLP